MNETRNANGASKRRKTLSAVLAIAMVLTMLLSGTLAYFYQAKVNNYLEGDGTKEVVGHDDFNQDGYKTAGEDGTHISNKDVYMENVGKTPVWVRVKFSEGYVKEGFERYSLDGDGAAHIMDYTATTENGDDPANGTLGTAGKLEDETQTPTHQNTFHEDFTWTMGGEATQVISAKDPIYTNKTVDNVYLEETDGVKVAHNNLSNTEQASDVKYKADLPACKVVPMAYYENLPEADQKEFVGWVGDKNGWFYWSQMLTEVNPFTGLLLNAVQVNHATTENDFKYNIEVTFEAVDYTDQKIWTDGQNKDYLDKLVNTDGQATSGAKHLMEIAYSVATGKEMGAALYKTKAEEERAAGHLGAAKAYEIAQLMEENPDTRYQHDAEYMVRRAAQLAEEFEAIEAAATGGDATALNRLKDDLIVLDAAVTDTDGDGIYDLPTTNAHNTKTTVSTYDDETQAITDDGLATALVKQYGSVKTREDDSKQWTLTYDEAKSVTSLLLDNNEGVQDFNGITHARFPYLDGLYIPRSECMTLTAGAKTADGTAVTDDSTPCEPAQFAALSDDVKQNIHYLLIRQQPVKTMDLSDFQQLEYLDLALCSSLQAVKLPNQESQATRLTGLSTDLTGISRLGTTGTETTYDMRSLTKLQFWYGNVPTSEFTGTNSLTSLKFLGMQWGFDHEGNHITAYNKVLDLSHSNQMSFVFIGQNATIDAIKFNKDAFEVPAKFDEMTHRWWGSNSRVPASVTFNTTDVLHITGIDTCNTQIESIGFSDNLIALAHKSSQTVKKWPTDHVVQEKIVDENNQASYWENIGGKRTPSTEEKFEAAWAKAENPVSFN